MNLTFSMDHRKSDHFIFTERERARDDSIYHLLGALCWEPGNAGMVNSERAFVAKG